MKDVVFVVRGDSRDVASSKYRVFQYLEYLNRENIRYKVVKPPRRRKAQVYLWIPFVIKLLLFGLSSKTIFVQKDVFYLGFWRFFKVIGKRIIYDFDDAIFVESKTWEKHVYSFPFEKNRGQELVTQMISLSDLVIVGNNYLWNFSRNYARRSMVIPMSLNLMEYQTKTHKPNGLVVIGWIGSPQTSQYLHLIEGALQRVTSIYRERVKVKIVTNGLVRLSNVEFEQVAWDQSSEVKNILSFDIGVVPLPQTQLAMGKSSFKLLQYMACGLPTVCSAVGFNEEIVVDGENGFLARETDDWVCKLSRLVEDLELRSKLGQAARKTTEKSYSLEINSALFCKAITNDY